MTPTLNPIAQGLQFSAYVAALARAKGNLMNASDFAAKKWPGWPAVGKALMTAVAPGDPNTPGWASELVHFGLAEDFLKALRARTVIDRLVGVRRAPFNTNVPVETSGVGGAWVGSGVRIPVWKSQFDSVPLPEYKAATLVVLLGELLAALSPTALQNIRESIVAGVTEYLDQQALDPSIAADGVNSPASITYGAPTVTSTGTGAAAVAADLESMVDEADADLVAPVWIMPAKTCVHVAAALGLPGIRLNGGELWGVPIITSKSSIPVGSPATRNIILLDANDVLIADEGGVEVEMSSVTSLKMSNAPASGNDTDNFVSLFQTGGAAVRVIRRISWQRTRTKGAVVMNVAY